MPKVKQKSEEEMTYLEKNVPIINNHDELASYLRPLYIIDDILVSYETYNSFMLKMVNLLRASFQIRQCREYPIKFKFYSKDKSTNTLQLRHFYINMILWEAFIELHGLNTLNKYYIMDCEKEIPNIEDYINYKLIQVLRDYHVKATTINYVISEILYNLRMISLDFSQIMNLNFSINTFISMYTKNDRIKELMESKFDRGLQPYEVESRLHAYEDEEIKIYKAEKDNPIGVILRANTGIKHKQFAEFTIAEGLKPTLTGETIPWPVENSTILRGANTPSSYYISAISSRKSLVTSKKVMGKAGYFGKIVLELARTLRMSTTISDCGTTHLVPYEVKTKKHLKKLNGKYYKMDPRDKDLQLINAKEDEHLIGKRIYARSAVTCALKDDCVCPRCIGYTSSTNFDIADGISGFESEEITKVVNQSILSTKHLLTTNSQKIEFNDEFYKFFSIYGSEINPIVNDNKDVPDIEDWVLYINPDDIDMTEEMDDDSLYNSYIKTGKFYVYNIHDPKNKIKMELKDVKEIYIDEEATELMSKNKGLIPFKEMDDDTNLFNIIVLNKELTAPLYKLMDLLNKNSDDDVEETIESMSQKMLDILVEAGIDANVIAAELTVNRLIRSVERPFERPDFTKDTVEPYVIYTVRKALEKNKSITVGISFQDVKRQILSDDAFSERNGTSYLDPFFQTQISTDNYKKYFKLIHNTENDTKTSK